MLRSVKDISIEDFSSGLNTTRNIFSLKEKQSPNMMNVKVNHDGSIEKRLGSTTLNSVAIVATNNIFFNPDDPGDLQTKIVSYWKLDEESGDRQDVLGYHPLSPIGLVIRTDGKIGGAAYFDGSQSLLAQNTNALITSDIDFSVAGWFRMTDTAINTIVAKRDGVQTDTLTRLLLHGSGVDGATTTTDASEYIQLVAMYSGAIIETDNAKFGTSSILMPGSYGGLQVRSSSSIDFSTKNWSTEFWIYPSIFKSTDETEVFNVHGTDSLLENRLRLTMVRANDGVATFNFRVTSANSTVFDIGGIGTTITTGSWSKLEISQSDNTLRFFKDGALTLKTDGTSAILSYPYVISDVDYGGSNNSTLAFLNAFSGYLDEIRISNYPVNLNAYTVENKEFGKTLGATNYSYWLYVNTDRIVTFKVSSSGTQEDATVRCTSMGACTQGLYYFAAGFHSATDNYIGVSVGSQPTLTMNTNTASYSSGIYPGSAPFCVGSISNGISGMMRGAIDEVGYWTRTLSQNNLVYLFNSGNANTPNTGPSVSGWGSYDFGAGTARWLIVAAGTGVYASSNMGLTFVYVNSNRTSTFQSFERSKNVLIMSSDNYDQLYAWSGSVGTTSIIMNPVITAASSTKYTINFQGFLIMLNAQSRRRGFFYDDENTQLTGTAAWTNGFDIPSTADDEITGAFILRRNLYVSTKYTIYRMSYVGGNPDWAYTKIKDWGYVPRTFKAVSLKDVGEVEVGLDWSRNIRVFDGVDDRIISDPVEFDNNLCDFAMEKISFVGSGLTNCFAENDQNEQVFRLCVPVGSDSTNTTHFINLDARSLAYYPYSNMNFNTMLMAESGNRRHFLAISRDGFVHKMNTTNLDAGTTVDDVYELPVLYDETPSQSMKGYKLDLFFANNSSKNVYVDDRMDFETSFTRRSSINITGSAGHFQIFKSIDIPESMNAYQARITSSSGTNIPWLLNRFDFFHKSQGIGKNG